jgi:hypothetical protein
MEEAFPLITCAASVVAIWATSVVAVLASIVILGVILLVILQMVGSLEIPEEG